MVAPVASAQTATPTVAIFGCNLSTHKAAAVFAAFIAAIGAALMGFVGLLIGAGVGFAAGSLIANSMTAAPGSNIAPPAAPSIGEGILPFMDGEVDLRGRTYDGILLWDDRQLEAEHDWVQQVFPTQNRSSFHPDPDRWVLTDDVRAAIRTSPARQNKLRQAYARVLQFFHLDAPVAVLPIWVTPGNHNFLRITRIINSLKFAGLEAEAQDLMQRLRGLGDFPGARQVIGGSFWIWEQASR